MFLHPIQLYKSTLSVLARIKINHLIYNLCMFIQASVLNVELSEGYTTKSKN